jgi:hypothetical protein
LISLYIPSETSSGNTFSQACGFGSEYVQREVQIDPRAVNSHQYVLKELLKSGSTVKQISTTSTHPITGKQTTAISRIPMDNEAHSY